MKQVLALGILVLASCGEPGRRIDPVEEDFAFLEIRLKG